MTQQIKNRVLKQFLKVCKNCNGRTDLESIARVGNSIVCTDTHRLYFLGSSRDRGKDAKVIQRSWIEDQSKLLAATANVDLSKAPIDEGKRYPSFWRIMPEPSKDRFAINPQYLLEVAQAALAVGADNVTIGQVGHGKPIRFEAYSDGQHSGFVGIVMPLADAGKPMQLTEPEDKSDSAETVTEEPQAEETKNEEVPETEPTTESVAPCEDAQEDLHRYRTIRVVSGKSVAIETAQEEGWKFRRCAECNRDTPFTTDANSNDWCLLCECPVLAA